MSRHAHCIFCDDIRMELGNKNSLMGIYGGILSVLEFPTILPKLCVMTYCETSVEQPFQSFSVRISLDGNLLNENMVPPEFLPKALDEWRNQGTEQDPVNLVSLGLSAIISPFVIEKESVLKVEVIADGEILTAGKLRLRKGPLPQPM